LSEGFFFFLYIYLSFGERSITQKDNFSF
jgi:hypothetical protein